MMAAGRARRAAYLGTTPATDMWAIKSAEEIIGDIRAMFDGTPPGLVPEVVVVERFTHASEGRAERQQSRDRGALVKHGRKAARWR